MCEGTIMGKTLQNRQLCFEAYIKTVQYLAGVTVHQHLWTEVVNLMFKFFSADFAAICERQEGGEIIIGSSRPENHPLHACLRESGVKGIIAEVFDSGFFATDDIRADEYHKVLFLPIASDNSTTAVLVTAHRSEEVLSRDHLNIYLAIAGITGTTHSRLSSETELRMHRNMLEELVLKRTSELNETILKLGQEVLQRTKAEAALQKLNEELEMRVAERTEELEMQNEELQETYLELEMQTEERVRAMEELREKEQMLIHQSRQAAMGEMIGNIAHQWRQPLNALGLTVQQLLMFYDLGELSRDCLDKSVLQSMELIQHMSRTIDDFRNYFRPDKEKVDFKVREAITNTLSLIEDSFKNQRIGIEVVAKNDPAIYGYPNEFAQALLNILNNARDALTEREIDDPRVTITICSEEGCAVVTVADNAGGIPEEIICKIFDPYFTTKGPQRGTGVGLFMSKAIIEKNMGGRLAARNIAGGAEFRIEV